MINGLVLIINRARTIVLISGIYVQRLCDHFTYVCSSLIPRPCAFVVQSLGTRLDL